MLTVDYTVYIIGVDKKSALHILNNSVLHDEGAL